MGILASNLGCDRLSMLALGILTRAVLVGVGKLCNFSAVLPWRQQYDLGAWKHGEINVALQCELEVALGLGAKGVEARLAATEDEQGVWVLVGNLYATLDVFPERAHCAALLVLFKHPIVVRLAAREGRAGPDGMTDDDDQVVELVSSGARRRYDAREITGNALGILNRAGLSKQGRVGAGG